MNVEAAVRDRYAAGARSVQPELCCPVDYDPRFLEVIPQEILDRDYGCGDPSPHLAEGDVVLDLGSGGGKMCWIASQVVGASGAVIGVDLNDEMLELARSHHTAVAARIGWDNVEFRKGRIQDLATRIEPGRGPLVSDESVDVVISNCVLNLVAGDEKQQLFGEIYRVTRRTGRVVISDIVASSEVPERLREDPDLWSGCISGAMTETGFLDAFHDAGFHGIEVVGRQADPWQTVEDIEFRSVTVRAWKGRVGPCDYLGHQVVYRGPFSEIQDDDGHTFSRGEATEVCEKTYGLLMRPPYAGFFEGVLPDGTNVPATARIDCGPAQDCC